MQEAAAAAAATSTVRATETPVGGGTDEDKGTPSTPKVQPGKLSPGGGWGGSYSIAKALADIAQGFGLAATSEKRDRRNTASGNPSDHWVGSKQSYAFDLSNGDSPTPEMDAAAVAVARKLGVKYDGKSELVLTVKVNGYRVQVLYRTQVGGDHTNHMHVGVRKI
jgi:hypothetical protein